MRVAWSLLFVCCSLPSERARETPPGITNAGLSGDESSSDESSGSSSSGSTRSALDSVGASSTGVGSESTDTSSSSGSETTGELFQTSSSELDTTGLDTSSSGDPKEPQPEMGLWSSCLESQDCLEPLDGCFLYLDEDMMPKDGYCTILCEEDVECGPQGQCIHFGEKMNEWACGLPCLETTDCFQGMECLPFLLPYQAQVSLCV